MGWGGWGTKNPSHFTFQKEEEENDPILLLFYGSMGSNFARVAIEIFKIK
jgi:hypothetical protein